MSSERRCAVRFIASTAVLAFSACVTESSKPAGAAAPRICVPVQELSEWEPFDDLSLILSTSGRSQAYLLHLTRPIEGLKEAEDIEIMDADHDGFICPASPDAVLITDCGSAGIASIHYLDKGVPEVL